MPAARVTFLGTGTSHGVPMIGCHCAVCQSSDPRDRRSRPSIHVAVDGGPSILVDTATDLRMQALTHGITRVDAVLYTHSHADHVMGLDDLRRFTVGKGPRLPVYAAPRTASELRRIFQYAFEPPTVAGGGVPELMLHEIAGSFAVGGVEVVPVPILHGPQPILGFRIGPFAYLTDCNAVPEASLALLDGLDVLVLDALRHRPHPTHFTVAEAVTMAMRVGARRTLFTHICHDLPHADTCAALPPGMALAFDGQVVTVQGITRVATPAATEARA